MARKSPTNAVARVSVVLSTKASTGVSLLHYGEDDRIPNPGDLLLVSFLGDQGGIEFAMLIPGSRMGIVAAAAFIALDDYEANKEWLTAPASTPSGGWSTDQLDGRSKAYRRTPAGIAARSKKVEAAGGGA